MARKKKRLNKKLVTILLLIGIPILLVMWYVASYKWTGIMPGFMHALVGRDPQKLLDEGNSLLAKAQETEKANREQANQIADPAERYEKFQELCRDSSDRERLDALAKFNKAFRYSQGNKDLRIQIIEAIVELNRQRQDYRHMIGGLNRIVELDATNYDAKRAITDFYYELARYSRDVNLWTDVQKQADMLIELKPDDPFGYVVKANALEYLLVREATEDPKGVRASVDELLQKALNLDDKNVLTYRLLADMVAWDGSRAENITEAEEYNQKAENYLQQAINKNPDDVEAYYALIAFKQLMLESKYRRVQSEHDKAKREALRTEAAAYQKQLLADLDNYIGRFSNDGTFYILKSQVLLRGLKDISDIDKVVDLCRKAIAKNNEEASWYASLAQMLMVRSNYLGNKKDDLVNAYNLLREALYKPTATDLAGPKRVIVSNTRYGDLIPSLIDACVMLRKEEKDESKRKKYLEDAYHWLKELREAVGEDSVLVQIPEGSIALSEWRQDEGLRKLYEANQQIELRHAQGVQVRKLKWKLFKALKDTKYQNLAVRFAVESFKGGARPDQDYVDYIETVAKLPGRMPRLNVLELIKSYKERYGDDYPFRQRILQVEVRALLSLGRLEEARKVVAELKGEDSTEMRTLKAESLEDENERIKALTSIVKESPGDKDLVSVLFNYHMSQAGKDASHYDTAREIVAAAVAADPGNLDFKRMQLVLQEPNPGEIKLERMREITIEVLKQRKDPYERALGLGKYYDTIGLEDMVRGGNKEKAQSDWEQAQQYYKEAGQLKKDDVEAMLGQFNCALSMKDFPGANKLVNDISKIDPLEGLYCKSRWQAAQDDLKGAASSLEKYLEQKPISVEGHLGLAQVYNSMQRQKDAFKEVQLAVAQDMYNVEANSLLALMIHGVNSSFGLSKLDMKGINAVLLPVKRILAVKPGDLTAVQLEVTYESLELVLLGQQLRNPRLSKEAQEDLVKAVVEIYRNVVQKCQLLLRGNPANTDNWRTLANAYYIMWENSTDEKDKQYFLSEADKIYKEGLKRNPTSVDLTAAYGSFLRSTGRGNQDEKMLQDMIAQQTGDVKREAMVKLGGLYVGNGRDKEAVALLSEVVKEYSDDLNAKVMLGELYMKMKEYEPALELFKQLRQKEDSEYLISRQIDAYLGLGLDDKANELLKEMEKKYPSSLAVSLVGAKVAMQNTNYAETIAYADKILAEQPRNRMAWLLKGQAQYYDGKFQEALDSLKQLRSMEASGSNLGRMELAQTYWRLGFYNDAVNELQAMVQADPGNQTARDMLIKMLKSRGRWEDLERFYDDTIKAYPKEVRFYIEGGQAALQLGRLYATRNQASRASRQYDKALRLMVDGFKVSQETKQNQKMVFNGLIMVMLQRGQYQEVLQLADQGLQQWPNDVDIMLQKAEAVYRLNREQEALNLFENLLNVVADKPELSDKVLQNAKRVGRPDSIIVWGKSKLQQRPNWTAMHLVLAGIYRDKGDVSQEIAEFKAAREAALSGGANDPKNQKLVTAIEKQMCITYLSHSRWHEAIELCRQLVKKEPKNSSMLNNLAYALMEMGGHDKEAVEIAKKAYEMQRNTPSIMDTYAMALLRTGDYKQAELIALRAIQAAQRTESRVLPEYEYHLAQALKGQERITDAQERLRRVLNQLQTSQDPTEINWRDRIDKLLQEISGSEK